MNGEWIVPGFRHVRQLGDGATGLVMQAEHLESGTPVAIKYLAPTLVADEEFLQRFREEARILADLRDPHLVRFHEYVESADGAAIVMELVDGVSLAQVISHAGPTTPEAALYVLKGSLLGLAAAHASGIVHRDFKPGNILVDGDGGSKLADFGIATRAGDNVPSAGTPAYMAPEQWGGRAVTQATDVYAATAVFYECLTGHSPYPSATLPQLALAHRTASIPTLEVPEGLRPLVEHGMAKDSYERPQTATAFLSELEAVAFAAYGVGWEEQGRSSLKERAALLAMLFPLGGHGSPAGGTTMATTALGASALGGWEDAPAAPPMREEGFDWDDDTHKPRKGLIAAVVAVVVVVLFGGGGAAIIAANSGGSTAAAGTKTTLSPSPPASDTPTDPGSPTDSPTDSVTPTPAPTPDPTSTTTAPAVVTTTTKPATTPTTTKPATKKASPTPKKTPFKVTGATAAISRAQGSQTGTLTVTITTVGTPATDVPVTITGFAEGLTVSPTSGTITAGTTSVSFTVSGYNCMAWSVSVSVAGFAPTATDPGDTYPAVKACG